MADIARAAGVGKATVSLALRNDPRLRRETCRRIRSIADRLGYKSNAVVANLMAQLRAAKDPKFQATIAIINAAGDRDFLHKNPTYSALMDGILERCSGLGYGANRLWLHDPSFEPKVLRRLLAARNIRGVVIAAMVDKMKLPAEFDPVWRDLSCVTVGIRPEHPSFHFACNDQFSTALHTARHIARNGYKKPALVIDPRIEKVIDRRFSAGFHAEGLFSGARNFVPPFEFDPRKKSRFAIWLRQYSPDVLVTAHPELREWISGMGLKCPRDIGLAHLDINKGMDGWSGMDQCNGLVGAYAIDMLVGMLHRGETGVPQSPKCIMTESRWIPGKTLKK
jgi:LacI family transcriptional regulator